MQRIMLIGLVLVLAGCGASEPSNKEIAQGMIQSFVRETGIPSSNLKATVTPDGAPPAFFMRVKVK